MRVRINRGLLTLSARASTRVINYKRIYGSHALIGRRTLAVRLNSAHADHTLHLGISQLTALSVVVVVVRRTRAVFLPAVVVPPLWVGFSSSIRFGFVVPAASVVFRHLLLLLLLLLLSPLLSLLVLDFFLRALCGVFLAVAASAAAAVDFAFDFGNPAALAAAAAACACFFFVFFVLGKL